LTRKYIAPFLFLYKNRAIGHGVQYKSNGQYQNLALQIEIPTARTLIDRLELSGKMVQLDGMHTQHETVHQILYEKGAHYSLILRGNQPTLLETAQQLLPADLPPCTGAQR
jgi:hypothetical protein